MSYLANIEDAIVARLKEALGIDNVDGARGTWQEVMAGLFSLPGVRVVYEGSDFALENQLEREDLSFTVLFACRDIRGAGRDDAYTMLEEGRAALRRFRPDVDNVDMKPFVPTKTLFVGGDADKVVYALTIKTQTKRRV